eukprot:gb/GECH01013474.1/.p1 GENE.gb/GECH01013474.1/~~gb/GECH01013474.1/.p1  ORF type:complete len:340 (+),score=77.63 gb/GECH01013474.1/:1-1020(+)
MLRFKHSPSFQKSIHKKTLINSEFNFSRFTNKKPLISRSYSSQEETEQKDYLRPDSDIKKDTMLEISNEEYLLNIVLDCTQAQVTTHNVGPPKDIGQQENSENVSSSILPYSIGARQRPLTEFYLVAAKDGPHAANFTEEKLGGHFSMVVGHTQPSTKMLFQVSRMPPRVALSGEYEKLTDESECSKIWNNHFFNHDNVSRKLNESKVALFRVKEFKSAYLLDLQNQMEGIYDFEKLVHDTDPDPLHLDGTSADFLFRINRRPKALKIICKAFGQNVSDAICLSVDRYAMDVLALPQGNPVNDPEAWVKLRLYFEQEITTQKDLFDFIFQLDPKISKLL